MAKTTGPLFSLEASGTIGNTITYSRWKGRPYVRRRVIPVNPMTADQIKVRNAMRVLGAGVSFQNATALINAELTLTDKAEIQAITPSDMAWNGYEVSKGIGSDLTAYDAATAAYAVLAANHAAYDTAAGNLVPPILAVAQGKAGGGFGTPKEAGEVYFHLMWSLYVMGLTEEPGAVPFVYA